MTITGIPRPGRAIIVQSDGKFTLPCPAPLKTKNASLISKCVDVGLGLGSRGVAFEHQGKGELFKPSPNATRYQ